jgi:4-hydroxythreonine-4-phosphate dehydrogenase
VGPEIALKAFARGEMPGDSVVIGDLEILEHCNRTLDLDVPLRRAGGPCVRATDALNVLDMEILGTADLQIGQVSRASGAAALQYVERATRLALDGELRAIVTLPMNKEATRLTEPDFSGHTGYIAALCGTSRYAMMLATDRLLVPHLSTHVALREAAEGVTCERVYEVILLTHEAACQLKRRPRIGLLGLNPHAGEGGAFGREEIEEIEPAVERAQAEGIDAVGPLPPDTVFARALEGDYGAVVCMYHDQGHVPMKLVAFDEAVNVTLGLPIVRTSVDHGTAFDIAWQGRASVTSFVNACKMAEELSRPD